MNDDSNNGLPLDDRRQLDAAEGWFGLGLYEEANAELDNIPAHLQQHPKVTAVRWKVNCRKAKIGDYLRYASKLLTDNPDDAMIFILIAEAIKQVDGGGVQDAYDVLRPVATRFDDCLTVSYNLAAYLCRLGKLDEAREWLRKTFQEAKGTEFDCYYETLAMQDDDLRPLWGEIFKIGKNADGGWLQGNHQENGHHPDCCD